MTAEEFAALPLTLTVRECQYQVTQPGFRPSGRVGVWQRFATKWAIVFTISSQ
jgi:hypothetical protein